MSIQGKYIETHPEKPKSIVLKPNRDALFAAVAIVYGADFQKLDIDPIEAMSMIQVMENLAYHEFNVDFLSNVIMAKDRTRVHAQAFKILLDKEGDHSYDELFE